MPERTSARASARSRVERLRSHFASADRVLIMMQDDPNPDAIASALALRTLLGRTKAVAPIATFGTITRPENRAMTRILDIARCAGRVIVPNVAMGAAALVRP